MRRKRERKVKRSMKDRLYDQIANMSYKRLLLSTLDLAIVAFRAMYCKNCPNRHVCEHPCPEAERRFKQFHMRVVAEKIALN